MRAYVTFKFDRAVKKDYHYLSPGGFEVVAGSKDYQFDFLESVGIIDNENPTLVHFELWDLDTDSFPESKELRNHLHEITELKECYCYTGESNDPEINCIGVEKFAIIDYGKGQKSAQENTKFINICCVNKNDFWCFSYEFSRNLLKTCKILS